MRGIGPASLPSRADARRNRDAILQTAEDAFRESTDAVGLDEIARRTGLGRATVYRHFPDRTALAIAVAAQHHTTLKRLADAHDTRKCAFRDLLRTVLSLQAARRALVGLFRELPERHQRRYVEALLTMLQPAFDRAQRAGELRGDIELTDLALVFEMVEAALQAGPAAMNRTKPTARLIEVILDGLFSPRVDQAEPIPTAAGPRPPGGTSRQ